MTSYKDIADKPEDDRITEIGNWLMAREPGKMIAVLTDSEKGKAERYIRKITSQFPEIEVVDQNNGPIKGCVTIRIRRKAK